tara:strand:- start:906 stop:2606 length:1701 start_codon:yes stop_codon:yes gene_type:complete
MKILTPITQKELKDVFVGKERIKIPLYQRRYSWEEKQIEDLWNDLMSLNPGNKHFFGTIVFMSRDHVAQEIDTLQVIDGQQRITTISILLCAIRDAFIKKNSDLKTRIKDIEHALWIIDRDDKKNGMRLVLGNLDKQSYDSLVMSNFDEITNQKIKNAYDFFYEKFNEMTETEIKEAHDKLMDNFIYVSVTATGHKEAYHLFEAMNNRGLPLSPTDLMKNYLLMTSSEEENIDEERIEKIWGDIIMNLDSIKGTRSDPVVLFFRQYFMSSKYLEINEKITENLLYEPTFVEAIKTEDTEKMLEHIRKQSELYNKMLSQRITNFGKNKDIEINKLLKDTKTISTTPFTLLLRAFEETEYDNLIKIIKMCNSLLIRRQSCGKSTAEHDSFFNHLAQNAFKNENPVEYIHKYLKSEGRFPDNNEFKKHFIERDFKWNDTTKYILSKIEESGLGCGSKEVSENRYKVHIEHILPLTFCDSLTKNWLKPNNISKEEHDTFRMKIGNLTLLERKPNISASNKTFKEKQKYYTEEKTDFKMTNQLLNYTHWGIVEIKKRSEELSKMAVGIWDF